MLAFDHMCVIAHVCRIAACVHVRAAIHPPPHGSQHACTCVRRLGPFNIWTETDPRVAAHNSTGNLNFLTGAGGFLENLVFGYGGLHYFAAGLSLSVCAVLGRPLVPLCLSHRAHALGVEAPSAHLPLKRKALRTASALAEAEPR